MSYNSSNDVPDALSPEPLLESESEELLPTHKSELVSRRRKKPWSNFTWWWLISMVFTSLLTLLLVVISRPLWLLAQYPEIERHASLNTYSPVYHDIDLRFDTVRQDGRLWWNSSQKYRQDPSPETDKAWGELTGDNANRMLVSKEDFAKAGIDLDVAVQWPGDRTGNTYIAEVNVFHLLHCLNEVRKATFLNYYETTRPMNPFFWVHYYHCLDMIRQDIMCRSSLDLVPLVWQQHQDQPFPHFSIDRKCVNWDDVVAYREKHILPHDLLTKVLTNVTNTSRISGTKEVPLPDNTLPYLQKLWGWQRRNQSEDTWVEQSDYGRSDLDMMPQMPLRPNEQELREEFRPDPNDSCASNA